MQYIVLEQANKYHVLSNLSLWRASSRKSLNKYLLEEYGDLNDKQQEGLRALKTLLRKYGKPLTYPFFRQNFSFAYLDFEKIITQEEFNQLKELFDIIQPWWTKVWAKEEGKLLLWKDFFESSDTESISEKILKQLQTFFNSEGTGPKETYLLISNPSRCGGGANLGPSKVTLECGGMSSARKPQVNRVLGTLWHECSHLIGRNLVEKEVAQYLENSSLDFLKGTEFEKQRKKLGIRMRSIFVEAVMYSLFPTGYLGKKYLDQNPDEKYLKIFDQKTYNPPLLTKWGEYACHFLTPVVSEYLEADRALDQEFLSKVEGLLEKFTKGVF